MKIAARTHPKLYDLCERLQCSRPAAIGYLELLWGGTSEHAPQGDVGKYTDGAIARWCDWDGEPEAFIRAMIDSKWIDENEEHRLVIHGWQEHAPNFVRAKLKKTGKTFVIAIKSTSEPSYEPTYERTYEATEERSADASSDASRTPTTRHATSSHATPRPAAQSRDEQAEVNSWEMLMSGGAAAGLEFPRKKLDACRERGLSPGDVTAVFDYWREHSSEFDGPGALIAKLDGMFSGQAVGSGWPKRAGPQPAKVGDVRAECAAVRALCDDELNNLAQLAFAKKPGLMANWKEQGRKSGACIEHIARFRLATKGV